MLRSYVKRFTQETLEVDETDDKVQLTAFKVGLKSRKFVVLLAKNPPRMMVEMLLKAHKYMNAEDALAAIEEVKKPNERERKGDDRRGWKREQVDHQSTNKNKRKDDKTPRTVKFTHLIMFVDKILAQIKARTTLSGQGRYTHHPMSMTRGNIVAFIKTMTIIQRTAET